jgi:hypothetical protein
LPATDVVTVGMLKMCGEDADKEGVLPQRLAVGDAEPSLSTRHMAS